ncbi:zinc ABC transporter substrate-binding protein AztC [Paenarthrobacter aurescens]|uniref:ABC transporter substrate-binding protein n=1 Tax=Paenarthrobacter aurescens TaxID=43663 RepID=A0A4Y3N9D1_PAEAU|nr:zinc ABC transporter substrate-binding protein AztC [Paenarthrobacter aurescens]MDO6143423.1 metal ABC transporter substrate-binding protein [Paenarthrobacter aurescens]MDO6147271.1 metal ABC transporter substrate-binding protein [Paenarthrobacter aurescens]MDO6158515.1 metal ABC transporter substrate-binding protein [Paenarthrobacter aurescens]MDO6162498.1 metal ABC transporter substrate-binding protein [Paenarthrobacter aurescens]GEB18242.1 ABC transporter substrate-binding protein [Paena
MRRTGILAVLLALGLGMSGCSQPGTPEKPQVVVTTNILGDVTKEVLGDQVDVTTLMQPNADPHSFEISAQQAALMGSADLVVSNGLGLEEGLQQHLDRAGKAGAPVLAAGEVIAVVPYSSGDAEGAPDPHFWTDPAAMIDVVDAVEAAGRDIEGIDPKRLASSAAAYRDKLHQLDSEMTGAFAGIPKERRALVTNHHVFGYLAKRFDFQVVGAIIPGGTTLAAPSAADLRQLSESIRGAGVRTIFADSSQPDRLVQVLASEAGVNVEVAQLFTESLTGPDGGAPTYLDMMRANTERIVTGLAP